MNHRRPGKVTICIVGTETQRQALAQWAKNDERSVSYIVRKLLDAEIERRKTEVKSNEETEA